MKTLIKYALLFAVVITTVYSCKKFKQTNLTESTVVLLSPANNQTDSILKKLFWWEEVTGAKKYQLQVVSPSFDTVSSLIIDTLTTKLKFELTLTPRRYQWRVRAINDNSETAWKTYKFNLSNTQSITGQTIGSLAPVNATNTNTLKVSFTWGALTKAESYVLKITNNTTNAVVTTQTLTTTKYDHTFSAEGNYRWSIQGINKISASLVSEALLAVDTTRPNKPVLGVPSNDTINKIKFPATVSWNDGVNNGTAITDSLWISENNTFTPPYLKFAVITGTTTYSVDTLKVLPKTVYWRVRSKDAAGNVSSYSDTKSFYKK